MTSLRYSAIRTRQTPASEWLISLSAPATDIERWAGIPQKQQKGGEETLGFQRDENETGRRNIFAPERPRNHAAHEGEQQ